MHFGSRERGASRPEKTESKSKIRIPVGGLPLGREKAEREEGMKRRE